MRFAQRLAITLSIPLVLLVLTNEVSLPGIPAEVAEGFGSSRASCSVFALGIQPIATSYWIVEVIAFLVRRWSHLRHGNPEGRAKLETAARILALVLAATQAFGMVLSLQAIGDSQSGAGFSISIPVVVASLVGGVCIQFVAARIISAQGLMNGFVAILGANLLAGVVPAVKSAVTHDALEGHTLWSALGLTLPAVLLVVGATWAALRGAGLAPHAPTEETSRREPPYRSARWLAVHPWIPVPSGSLQPYFLASALIVLPATMANLGLPFGDVARVLQRGEVAFTVVFLTLAGVATVVFAWFLHRPAEMADLSTRLGAADEPKLQEQAREALRRTLLPSLLYLVAIALSQTRLGAAALAILTVMAMDFFGALRQARENPNLVPVWEERRASAVPVLRAALAAEGIATETRGMAFLGLWQIFAPYAPAVILVDEQDAERATGTLRSLLRGEERPAGESAPSGWQVPTDPWALSRRAAILGGFALGAVALTVVSSLPSHEAPGQRGPRAKLEVLRVDDTIDPFATLHDDAIPAGQGISIFNERVPVGPGSSGVSHFARIVLREGEGPMRAVARAQPWLSTLRLPIGARFGFEEVVEYDPDTKKAAPVGVRTFVLVGAPVLQTADVTDAAVSMSSGDGVDEYYVAVTLSDEAARRFEAATREWTQRRIAIVIDDVVNSAPVVKTAIGGGRISITLGQGDPDQQRIQATQLARGLGGR